MKLRVRPREEPSVNLTSLIDVVLLLLIFFMVSTSFVKESQINIRLPEADSSRVVEEPATSIDIFVTASGQYWVNGRELINNRPETLISALTEIAAGRTDLPILLSADADARHQLVVTAMDAAGRLGFTQVNIATVNAPGED